MSRYTEILNLPEQDVTNLSYAYEGYATSLISEMEETRIPMEEAQIIQPWIASSFLLSALWKAITNPQKSKDLFNSSANLFRLLNQPYWKVIAICGFNYNLLKTKREDEYEQYNNEYNRQKSIFETSPNDYLFEILRQYFLISSNDINIQSLLTTINIVFESRQLQGQIVGRLGIPISIYIDAIRESIQSKNSNNTVFRSWSILLERASEAVELARGDLYHWQKMSSTVVIEPEILASCICLCTSWIAKGKRLEELNEGIEVNRLAKVPLQIALELSQEDDLQLPNLVTVRNI